MQLNYNHLYYFYVAARSDSFTRAAKTLRIRQPTLTAQIKLLERTVGKQLFKKSGRRAVLTEEGKNVLEYCARMFSAATDLEQYLGSGTLKIPGHFRIGLSDELDRLFITSMLSHMKTDDHEDDGLRMTLTTAPSESLIAGLRSSLFDCILSAAEIHAKDIETVATASFPVVLAFNPKVFDVRSFTAAGLRSLAEKWALPARGRKLRAEADRYFEQIRLTPGIAFESDMIASVAQAAALGLGITLLPYPYIADYVHSGELDFRARQPHGMWLSRIHLHTTAEKATGREVQRVRKFLTSFEIESTKSCFSGV